MRRTTMPTSSPWAQDDLFLLVGGYNLIGDGDRVNSLKLPDATATIEETTGLGTNVPIHKATGHKEYDDIEVAGWFSDATDSINVALAAGHSQTARVFMGGDAGKVAGDPFQGGTALDMVYKRRGEPKMLQKADGSLKVTDVVHHGVLLKALAAVTADGDTKAASHDIGASTVVVSTSSVANPSVIATATPHGLDSGDTVTIAGHAGSTPSINGDHVATVLTPTTFTIPVNVTVGGTGGTARRIKTSGGAWSYAEVPSLTLGGHTNLTFEFWDSVDNAVWVTLGTVVFTTGPNAGRVQDTGTINRYTAVSWDFTGAGSGPSATIMAGIARL